jgi:hypothetical protein
MCGVLYPSIREDDTPKLRDKEAIYLTDAPDYKPIVLKVNTLSGVYASRSLNGHVRNVLAGEKVHLLAYHPDAYFIREVSSGKNGWVNADHIEPVDKKTIDALMATIEEHQRIEEAIRKHEVLPGMNTAQVEASLGEPTETSFRIDENGRVDIWKFIEYEREYETQISTNRYTGQTFYRRVPIMVPESELQVEFKDGYVTAIQKKKSAN